MMRKHGQFRKRALRQFGQYDVSRLVNVTFTLLAGLIALTGLPSHAASDEEKPPEYVTAVVCAECHQDAYKAWQGSHHDWALKQASPESVLGDFDDAIFDHKGVVSRFSKRDGKYYVQTDGQVGKLTHHEIKYSVGVTPLQQYLVELDDGRLQALDVAWDTEEKRWFHLYPDETLKPGDGLHWTGPYKNWSARCADCHQTNFVKNYAPRTKSYRSQWSEPNVACEACHGPGSSHVLWAKDPQAFKAQALSGLDEKGLTTAFTKDAAKAEVQLCATCHSRRSPLGPDSPPTGARFADHYRLALLRDGLYYADGQINDEVYVYGSFLQSKMNARGVTCSNCHEPHSGELVAKGNNVCTQCHNPAGSGKFPTLKKTVYDAPSHHRHARGSRGAQCVACHMPAKTYMQVDPRRDHSFRVPRPDLSDKIGTPNACTSCHQDKSATWATVKVQEWYPNGRSGTPHYGEILHAGRTSTTPETAANLIKLAADLKQPAIVRATALSLLRRSLTQKQLPSIAPFLEDTSDLVRLAALRLLEMTSADNKVSFALMRLMDSARVIRQQAARMLMTVPSRGLPEDLRGHAKTAMSDYRRSLLAVADFPETHMQIAGLSMVLRNFPAAQKALKTALEMDPQLVDAWLTLARIQATLQKPRAALKTLEAASKKLPDNPEVQFQLGAFYAKLRDHHRAVKAFEQSLKLSGGTAELLELLANSHMALGNLEDARIVARRLSSEHPSYEAEPLVQQLLRSQPNRNAR